MMSANIYWATRVEPVVLRRQVLAGLAALKGRLAGLRARISVRLALRQDLRRLSMTDARLLRDVGIDPAWAEEEVDKPLWRR